MLAAGVLGSPEELAPLGTLVLLDSHQSALQRVADVVLPVRVAAEKRGSFTNAAGIVQTVEPAVEPAFEAWGEAELLWRLGALLGVAEFSGRFDPAAAAAAAP